MTYKKLIIIVLVFSMVLGLIPLNSVECITPVSAAHLVCRNCGYKETLDESSSMCAAAMIPTWLIKKIIDAIIWLGKEAFYLFISKDNSSNSGKFRCPKCNSTNIYCDD